jgi:hypothetical protein
VSWRRSPLGSLRCHLLALPEPRTIWSLQAILTGGRMRKTLALAAALLLLVTPGLASPGVQLVRDIWPGSDRPDHPRGCLSGHRRPRRSGPRLRQRGREAGDLRLHRRRRGSPGDAELDRYRPSTLRRISRAGRCVRAAGGDRAGEGHLDGASGLDEQAAFEMLRGESRRTNRKIADLAEAVVAGHPLLPRRPSRETMR